MELSQSEFTDTQIVKISQLWSVESSDIKEMIEVLEPMLRKTEAKTIFEFMVQFSTERQVPLSCLSDFVRGLFTKLRVEKENNPQLGYDLNNRGAGRVGH
jgi:hypothetical protein